MHVYEWKYVKSDSFKRIMLCHHKALEQNIMIAILIREFEYFVISWSLYNRLQDDFKLPTMKTLSALTLKVKKFDDFNFLGDKFCKISES